MIDLGQLEAKLNDDHEFRRRFLASPAQTLEEEGVKLTPDMAAQLSKTISAASEKWIRPPGASYGVEDGPPQEPGRIGILMNLNIID